MYILHVHIANRSNT